VAQINSRPRKVCLKPPTVRSKNPLVLQCPCQCRGRGRDSRGSSSRSETFLGTFASFSEVHRAWVLSVSRIPERHGRHPVFTPASVGLSAPSPPKCSYFRARRRKEGVEGRKRTHTACGSSFRFIIFCPPFLPCSAFSLPFASLFFMRSLSTNVTPPPVPPISHHWHQNTSSTSFISSTWRHHHRRR